MTSHASPTGKLAGLDGLRALAVAFVLFSHAAKTAYFPFGVITDAFPKGIGKFGVYAFFILSGFLITHLLLKEEGKTGTISLRRFYARQVLRIVPVLYAYLIFLVLWDAVSAFNLPWRDVVSVTFFFKHVVLGVDELAHFWTLSIQVLFYLGWPLFMLAVKPARRLVAAGFLFVALWSSTALLTPLFPPTAHWYPASFFRGEGILLGCLVALAYQRNDWREKLERLAPVAPAIFLAALVAALGLLAAQKRFGLSWLEELLYGGQLAATVVVLLAAVQCRTGLLANLLANPVAAWLGQIAFSTYVWQQFFFFGKAYHWTASWLPKSVVSWAFWFPVNLVLCVAVGAASFYLIEKPMRQWRERAANFTFRRLPVTPAAA